MRILHLSTWKTGGAAIAASRLSNKLNSLGINSEVLHMSNRLPAYIDAAIGKLTKTANPIFHSYNYFGEDISGKIREFKPDIIHIHWVGAGFITPESLAQFNSPIVWTLHDLWPLCGAEHLPGSNRYIDGYLKNNRPSRDKGLDLDLYVWERKMKVFKNLNISFIAPSKYVFEHAKRSKLIDSHKLLYIPNGLDMEVFNPVRKKISDKKVVLFVANNPLLDLNKGYLDFQKAISLLPTKLQKNLEIKIVRGEVSRDRDMAKIYSSATVTVVPSKMETLSFVTMESMVCGTPVVAYKVGGIPDLIDHNINGYLAKPGDIRDLSAGIEKILSSSALTKKYGEAGREKIKSFDIKNVARKYRDLYRDLI